jgi:Type VI secretion system/phage-baseplate injector OB domain
MDEFTAIEKTIRQQQNRYYGKYRAFIADNEDPESRGRCKLTIPSVLGETISDWALPCFAYGGGQGFGVIAVPPVDSQVVAEFMEGDISSPLWTGAFWRTSDEVPEEFTGNSAPTAKVMKTDSGHVLVFEDAEGDEKITLKSSAEAVLEMDPNGSFALTDSGGATVTLDASSNEIKIEDANGNSMVMSSSGITLKDSSGNEIATTSGGINIKAPATVTIEGASVAVGGSGGEPLIKGTTFLSSFNAHTHITPGFGAPSGPPLPPLTPAALTTKTTAL